MNPFSCQGRALPEPVRERIVDLWLGDQWKLEGKFNWPKELFWILSKDSSTLEARRKKKPVVPVPNRPYFFLPTLLFFQRD